MIRLWKLAITKEDDNERLFENSEDEEKFDKLLDEGIKLYIEEEWKKEKDKVYPEHEFSERHKKQMKKLFKKVARREKIRNFFRIS